MCKICGKTIKIETKNKTKKISINTGICSECAEKEHFKQRMRQKINNPNLKNREKAENEATYELLEHKENLTDQEKLIYFLLKLFFQKQKEEKIEESLQKLLTVSNNMKNHNPMFDKNNIEKMKQTQQSMRENGKIALVRGSKRKNFKRSRTIQNYIRLRLFPWKKKNFERTNYTCEVCGKRGRLLHVHHLEPFIDIFNYFINKNNLNNTEIVYMSPEYLKLEEDIVNYHFSKDIGLVVCEDCHAKVDKKYHARHKKESVNENLKN